MATDPIMPYTCPHCGDEYENKSDMMDHLKTDNCKELVRQQIELFEVRNGEKHQADLADFADWGE